MTANPLHADTLSLNLELVIHTAAATRPRRHTLPSVSLPINSYGAIITHGCKRPT